MTELLNPINLFFILPGFITFLLIRYISLFSNKQTQVEFVFYSLACSIPSYLVTTIWNTGDFGSQLIVQTIVAIVFGIVSGFVIKTRFRKNFKQYSPWHSFCWDNIGKYVIVYTSTQRIYGWISRSSIDGELGRTPTN